MANMSHSLIYFVVEKDDGFIAHDSHSGGYPYKTDFASARKHNSLIAAMESKRSDNGTGILCCKVTTSKVQETDIQEELRRTAMAKLSTQEIRALGLDKR